jgi:hypothetical protein
MPICISATIPYRNRDTDRMVLHGQGVIAASIRYTGHAVEWTDANHTGDP